MLAPADRAASQVEFGANQVILVRSMAAVDDLPPEIRNSNALIMTIPQAKGLEFDDVFLVDFFANSPASAAEWRVLNAFCERLRTEVGLWDIAGWLACTWLCECAASPCNSGVSRMSVGFSLASTGAAASPSDHQLQGAWHIRNSSSTDLPFITVALAAMRMDRRMMSGGARVP